MAANGGEIITTNYRGGREHLQRLCARYIENWITGMPTIAQWFLYDRPMCTGSTTITSVVQRCIKAHDWELVAHVIFTDKKNHERFGTEFRANENVASSNKQMVPFMRLN